jgi:hypothetical protein
MRVRSPDGHTRPFDKLTEHGRCDDVACADFEHDSNGFVGPPSLSTWVQSQIKLRRDHGNGFVGNFGRCRNCA